MTGLCLFIIISHIFQSGYITQHFILTLLKSYLPCTEWPCLLFLLSNNLIVGYGRDGQVALTANCWLWQWDWRWMYVFFLDILLHPFTPLLVMTRRWCDRSGARWCRELWECCVVVERVVWGWGGVLRGKHIERSEGNDDVGEKRASSEKLVLTFGPSTLGHMRVCAKALLAAPFRRYVYASCPIGDTVITGKCTDSIPGPWCVCVQVYVCRHARVMFKRVCVCKSIWGVIAGSLLVWENHTSCLLPTPCQGQDPLTAPHCYFFMFVKCGASMFMHIHTYTDVVSSSHLFRHLSLPSETEFVNSVQTTPLESRHSVSQSHLRTINFLSN